MENKIDDINIYIIIERVEEQLKNNYPVKARDIWHLIDYIKEKQ